MNAFRIIGLHALTCIAATVVAAMLAGPAHALQQAAPAADRPPAAVPLPGGDFAAQQGGMSLSDAVESIRRRSDVERIISAETRVSNGRETHHIRAMTKDGKVKTFKVPGRRQD